MRAPLVALARWPTAALALAQRAHGRAAFSAELPRTLITLSGTKVAVGEPPRTLVDGLTLTIGPGDRWAILGANGCGKSVTAQLLGQTLLQQQGGEAPTELVSSSLVSSSAIASSATASTADRSATYISFESHRRLLRDEATEYAESRFSVVHRRATAASYLFPELYPDDAADDALRTAGTDEGGAMGFRPARTRVAPLPVPYDAPNDHPLLAKLEAAVTCGEPGRLMRSVTPPRRTPAPARPCRRHPRPRLCPPPPDAPTHTQNTTTTTPPPVHPHQQAALQAALPRPRATGQLGVCARHRRPSWSATAPLHLAPST